MGRKLNFILKTSMAETRYASGAFQLIAISLEG